MKIVQFKRNIKSGSIRRKVDLIHIIINACEMINLNQFMSLENIDKLEGDYPSCKYGKFNQNTVSEHLKYCRTNSAS